MRLKKVTLIASGIVLYVAGALWSFGYEINHPRRVMPPQITQCQDAEWRFKAPYMDKERGVYINNDEWCSNQEGLTVRRAFLTSIFWPWFMSVHAAIFLTR